MFATVYEARVNNASTAVAIKVLHEHWVEFEAVRDAFVEEANRLMRCRHPHIVTAHGRLATTDGVPAMSMELLSGQTLASRIGTQRRISPITRSNALAILKQLAEAIDYLNRDLGVAHLDVRPANILLSAPTGKPFVKLGDLGLSRLVGSESAHLGFNDYSAPEVHHSPGRFGTRIQQRHGLARADTYSLAVLATEMLATFPLHGERDRDGPWVRHLPIRAEVVLSRGMSAVPADRQASANDLIQDLSEALESERWPEKAAASSVGFFAAMFAFHHLKSRRGSTKERP